MGKGTYVGGMSKLRFCGFHVLWDTIHYLHKYDSEIYITEHSIIEHVHTHTHLITHAFL